MGKLVGAWHWALLLARGRRCWACHGRYIAHAPWQLYDCNRRPLAIEVIESEREQVAI